MTTLQIIAVIATIPVGTIVLMVVTGCRWIPKNKVGIVENLWSTKGLIENRKIVALNNQERYQDTLVGGMYFKLWHWQYSVHKVDPVIVPSGHVGVVVSNEGEETTLKPGKYALNTITRQIVLVPTTNFVLNKSIELITSDAYEPVLPLSVVIRIDAENATKVINQFGSVKQLIDKTIDPLLNIYFQGIAHNNSILELILNRAKQQAAAKTELKKRFEEFNIQCIDVLVGKPDGKHVKNLLDKLRQRTTDIENVTQEIAINDIKAKAAQKLEANLTAATFEKARNESKLTAMAADANKIAVVKAAEAASEAEKLKGEGESSRIKLVGDAEAEVIEQKVHAFGDPQLFTLDVVSKNLAESKQPLVPQHVINGHSSNTLELLLSGVTAEKVGFPTITPKSLSDVKPEALETVAENNEEEEEEEAATNTEMWYGDAPTPP